MIKQVDVNADVKKLAELNKKLAIWQGFEESVAGKKMSPFAAYGDKLSTLPKVPKYCEWQWPNFTHNLNICIEYLVEPNPNILWVKFIRLIDRGIVCHIKLRDGSTAMGKALGDESKYATALCIALEELIDRKRKEV